MIRSNAKCFYVSKGCIESCLQGHGTPSPSGNANQPVDTRGVVGQVFLPVVGWKAVDGVEQLGIRAHGEIHRMVGSEKTQNAMGAADGFDRTATPGN
jgi:hypothetical protein